MCDDNLLSEAVVAVGIPTLALTAPHPNQGQKGQHRPIEVRAFAQVSGIGWDGEVLEGGEIPPHRWPLLGGGRIRFRHDSSVISRYSAYSANQVMTSTAATNMISKKSTTGWELTWDNGVTHNSPGNVDYSYRDGKV